MNLGLSTSLIVLSLLAMGNSIAASKECIQAPSRSTNCPHLLFKKSAVAVPSLGITQHEVICICLSDLSRNFNPQSQTAESIKQQVIIQRIAINYGLSEEDVVNLVKN